MKDIHPRSEKKNKNPIICTHEGWNVFKTNTESMTQTSMLQ